MNTDDLKKLRDLIGNFATAMLITRGSGDVLHARPMELVKVDDAGTIWFLSSDDSGKVHEIDHDARVNVIFQKEHSLYVSVNGVASISRDRQKIAELWKEPFRVWFPGGKEDARISLIAVEPQGAEYWDSQGWNKVSYLLRAAQAYASGKTIEVKDGDEHGVLAS
jgi:general stress protein 26